MPLCLPLLHLFVFGASLSEAISAEDQEMITFLHISARMSVVPPAANMHSLLWSVELENLARIWVNKCSWGFPDPAIPDERSLFHVGINAAMISTDNFREEEETSPSISAMFNLWYVNKAKFDYHLNICRGGYCGQYRQIIWATTEYLGCELGVCDMGIKCRVLVCCYYPPGNDSDSWPYEQLGDGDDEEAFLLDEEPWIMRPLKVTGTKVLRSLVATAHSTPFLICFLAFLLI
ncbi:Peptidase inhibitor 16 [Taenia crassiceps]|uniref:Peptidase inhibitor 16 n=1 Tax=Taenia crassiceps TaxID=6207 RepID=A0ABR4Q4F0_9CEST